MMSLVKSTKASQSAGTEIASRAFSRLIHQDPHAYKGRLGYACINTILRHQKPPVFCSRTCRLETVRQKGFDYVKTLALQNVRDLKTLIEWNEVHHIKFLRISSDVFPFASHDSVGYSLDFAKQELAEIGKLASRYNHRLTMHPGQYNQLASPNPSVVAKTISDLDYHATMLDYMELPPDSIMIIHMGGVYGDKPSALARFEKTYNGLPEHIKRRLVLENDELGYSVSDLLPVCQKLNIPLVLDWHHHSINPGQVVDLVSLVPEINQTWIRKGMKPKQHYSESRPGAVSAVERRAHSDRVKFLPPSGDDVDLMIEAKDKEQAVFSLYKRYGLAAVEDDVWVPEGNPEPVSVKRRKTTKIVRETKTKQETRKMTQTNPAIYAEASKEIAPGIRTRLRSSKQHK